MADQPATTLRGTHIGIGDDLRTAVEIRHGGTPIRKDATVIAAAPTIDQPKKTRNRKKASDEPDPKDPA